MGDIARGFTTARVAVAGAATLIADNRIHKNCVLIKNLGPNICYIGPNNTVNSATGYPIFKNETLTFGLQERSYDIPGWSQIEIWGVSAGTSSMAVLQERV